MQSDRSTPTREEMLELLVQRATLALGVDRARDLQPTLQDVTDALWHLGQRLPNREELPGF